MTSSIILDQDRDGIDRMIDDIDAEVRMTRRFIGKNALSPQVIEAMRSVPRKEFVPENQKKNGLPQWAIAHWSWTDNIPTLYRGADDRSIATTKRFCGT